MKKLTLVYMGTPDFSAELLEFLSQQPQLDIKYVVTQEDKKVGRKQILTESPVKKIAKKLALKVVDELFDELNLTDIDMVLVYAYGNIIPANFLQQPVYGFINFHPSLLPKYRGPSPTLYPIILNEEKTGITIIQMDEKIDHGSILDQVEISVLPDERRSELEKRLTEPAGKLFMKLVKEILEGKIASPLPCSPQNERGATYTRLIKKDDGFIPFEVLNHLQKTGTILSSFTPSLLQDFFERNHLPTAITTPPSIYHLFRGLYPWPGVWTTLPNAKRLKITDMSLENNRVVLKKVQLEGKNEVDFSTFQKAYKLF